MSDQEWDDSPEEITDVEMMSPTSRYLATGKLDPSIEMLGKRKGGVSPPEMSTKGPADLVASLNLMKATLNSAVTVTRIEFSKSDVPPGMHRLSTILADLSAVLDGILADKGNLVSYSTSPSKKKPKTTAAEQSARKPVMADASTDTILTPSWWDSDSVIEARAASKRKKAAKHVGTGMQKPRDTEAESAMETDAENWSMVVKNKHPRKRASPAVEPHKTTTPGQPQKTKTLSKKPPAVLIKPSEGKTFADTLRTLRSSGLSAQDIGANVTMRQTRDGCLLMELAKGAKSGAAAKNIASAISAKLGDSVGKVIQLGVQVEVEILDLDAVSSAAEVLEALRAAIPGDDPAAVAEREAISDVRIWPVRSGQQIATAKVSKYAASLISRIPVGWTMCRVRPRTLPPERCFRCQAFGHNSRSCTAADRSGACWRCGCTDHRMANCKADQDRCLACDTAGLPKVSHKPGSGACAARRMAAGVKITTNG